MGANNPRTKGLSNKKQKARKLGIDVSGITISNKLNDSELQALDKRLNDLIKTVEPNYKPKDFKIIGSEPKREKHKRRYQKKLRER